MPAILSCLNHVKRHLTGPASMKNKRPPAPSLYTDVCWCGDRSGSMSSMGLSPQEGAETFMKDHKKLSNKMQPINGYHMEFTTFDNKASIEYNGDAQKVTDSDIEKARNAMVPRGTTKFYDTAIACVSRQQKRVDAVISSLPKETAGLMYENNHLVTAIFATFTDGMDNESIADASALKRAIDKHKSQYNATCMFLAANIDADTTGASCGFDAGLCMQMGADRISSGEALRICSIAMMRAASQQPPQFTQLERESSCRVTRPVNSAPSAMMQGPQRCVTGPSLRQPAPLIPPPGVYRQTNHRVSLRTPAV